MPHRGRKTGIRYTRFAWRPEDLPSRERSGGGQPCHPQPFSASLRLPQVVLKLLIEPTLRTGIEGDRKTHSHLWAYAGTAVHDPGQGFATDPERSRGFRDGQIQGFQAQGLEYLSRVRWTVHLHVLVVVLIINAVHILPGTSERDTLI